MHCDNERQGGHFASEMRCDMDGENGRTVTETEGSEVLSPESIPLPLQSGVYSPGESCMEMGRSTKKTGFFQVDGLQKSKKVDR